MILVDTHSHVYLPEFDTDRDETILRAKVAGVRNILLPAIDSRHHDALLQTASAYPGFCLPMMGLHPTSVKTDYPAELAAIRHYLETGNYVAIGEVGIDLYWDTTFATQQIDAFRQQIAWSREFNLPLVIHSRNSMSEIVDIMRSEGPEDLRGVFHCYSGNVAQAIEITGWGFYLGIGGVLTYRNSALPEVVRQVPAESLILETDAPYLAPVPYRGKRNEPAYLMQVVEKLGEILGIGTEKTATLTTTNACRLFGINMD
jgi:TatD DNase family protein